MRSLVFTFLICSFVGYGNAAEETSTHTYSVKEVVLNIEQYKKVIFSETPPSIDDYYFYEGIGAETEYILQLQKCLNDKNISYTLDTIFEFEPKCRSQLQSKFTSLADHKSLFYARLRDTFDSATLNIGSEPVIDDSGWFYEVNLVSAKAKDTYMVLLHAVDTEKANLGFILVSKIVREGREVIMTETN